MSDFFTADRVGSKPELVVMVGLPRSGKTTEVNRLHTQCGHSIICGDDFRRAIGVRFQPALEPTVKAAVELAVRAQLIRGLDVVVDEINITQAARQRWYDIARQLGATVCVFVVAEPPEEEHLFRCKESEFPIHVLRRMMSEYQPPSSEELKMAAEINR